ncbi:carboxypeptidase regulatory-like domain-containing protein [Candidatus Kaiserbacteria bacterium]|nr:carboxypeptidase regulatory-like domain-containing protein [Candidatus Kaiserbacteria bacterium]
MKLHKVQPKGLSLVEVIIVAALTTLVFGTLMYSFKFSLELINHSRAKLSALSVANDRMEYFRSLPYDDVGVVAGYPAGTIPQNSTTTLNGIEFIERVRVDYVDDDADGTAGADSNGIILDYKKVRLEYTWEINGATSSIQLVTNIVPRSVETTAGGGTARINVLDSDSSLLPGASVRLFSSSSTFAYDVTTFTDASGASLFNIPADSGYQVEVTANISGQDYSTAQTYVATTSNPNPIVAPFSVVESDVSTLTFQIGELSDLNIRTFSAVDDQIFTEDFTDLLSVASSSDVSVTSGNLVLENNLGVYDSTGYVYLGPITPTSLVDWNSLRIATDIPTNTSHSVQFYTSSAPDIYDLIPEVDLPGNNIGFTGNIVDLSILEPLAYPTIYIGITLNTTDTSVTPEIDEVNVFYRQSETFLPNMSFDVHGSKTIGTDASAQPIYKYLDSLSTNGSGVLTISDLEFDDYTFDFLGGYDIASACPANPYTQIAGEDGELDFVLTADSTDTLRVTVVDASGQTLPGVSVNLTRSGYDVTHITDGCGQVFFSAGVSANTDYTIDVSATGYTDETVTLFEVNADTATTITLTE